MKIAAILPVLMIAGSRLPAQGPSPAGVQQRNAVAVVSTMNQTSPSFPRVAGVRHTREGAILGGMAGLMTGIVFSTVAGPVGDAADTPAGAIKVTALSIAAGIAVGALIGSMFH